MVEGQVKEERLAGDGLEVRRELHQVGLLAEQGGVQVEGLQAFTKGLPRWGEGLVVMSSMHTEHACAQR